MARQGAFSALVKEFGNEENEAKKEHESDEKKAVEGEGGAKTDGDAVPKKAAKLMQGM